MTTMKFSQYSGTADQYIREYLDPDDTIRADPPQDEGAAVALWESLEDVFRDDGGTGMSCGDFVKAVLPGDATMTESEITEAVRLAALEVGAKVRDVQGFYEAGGGWDAETPKDLADLIVTCWREQAAAM